MPLKGIIDLGSNSVRLVVYEVSTKNKDSKLFRDVVNEKQTCGLSAYVENGSFTKDGINCAISVLQDHIHTARNVGCESIHIFATAVLRNSNNCDAAVKKIEKAIDTPIDVISAEDEAHLGFVGASYGNSIEEGTLIDIGGGSTELASIHKGEDALNISIPQGSVSSYAQFVKMILPTPEETAAIRDAFAAKLTEIDLSGYKAERLYGIGGSVRAVDKLYATAFSNENRLRNLETYQIEALSNLLENQPSTFAHAATKAVPDRLHSIVPGMTIVQTLLAKLDATSLTICKYGIREGYLLERVLKV